MGDGKKRRLLPHARPGRDEGADLEVEHHLAERVDRLVEEGWDPAEAEAEARRRFGDVERIRREIASEDRSRGRRPSTDGGLLARLAELSRDARLAARALARRPVFTVTAALTLAVAIAGNATIFSVVHATLLRPLPFPEADRLMRVFVTIQGGERGEVRDITISYPKYEVLRDRQEVFDALSLFRATSFTLTGEFDPERIDGEYVSAGHLEMLGVRPVLGRTFRPEEDAVPERDWVALVGHGLWRRRYGGDPGIVGRSIRLGERAYQVVGVLPEGFEGLTGGAEVWVPIMTLSAGDLTSPGSHNKHVLARLRPGVSPERARAAVIELGREIHEVYPGWGDAEGWGADGVMLSDERMDPDIRASILFLFGAVGFLLLIACVNVANLFLARTSSREREIAIRKAMGAGRGRIVRQLMTESVLVAALGGVLGLVGAVQGVQLVERIAPVAASGGIFRSSLAGLTEIGLASIRFDGTVLLFGAGIVLLSAFLFGLAPALHAAGGSLVTVLRDGGRGTSARGMGGVRGQRALVVAELALTFALLVGAGLMLQSMSRLLEDDGGFVADGVLTARLAPPSSRYDGAGSAELFEQLTTRLEALPGVETVARSHCLPLSRSCDGTSFVFLDLEGAPTYTMGIHWVSPSFFSTLRVPVVEGRGFESGDRRDTPVVAVVSETAARRYWPRSEPIGDRLFVNGDTATVVGVVADVQFGRPSDEPTPEIYLSTDQIRRRSGYLFLRTTVDPAELVPGLRAAVRELDADLPLIDVRTLESRVDVVRSGPRFGTSLLAVFGLVALLLAAIGIYGVVAFGVARQTHEMGVRIAIGAERMDVLRMVVGRGVGMALAGVLVGTLIVLALVRVLQSVLFGVEPFDPPTLLATAAVLTAVAALASYLPARRAVSVDPLTALRAE